MADTKEIFCAREQKLTPHVLDIDGNGEILATCSCGRFLKFAADTKEELDALIVKHEESNDGQITEEARQAKLKELL